MAGHVNKNKIEDCPVVSFCISSFRRYEILRELVEEILLVQSEKMEVIVCDDKSLDGSAEKIREISDHRLKVYVNEENVGSSLNIHDSLDRGKGMYLFYVNERDNVDNFKIEKLIDILEKLEEQNVAFAKCYPVSDNTEKYHIFNEGEDSLIQFACKIDHPTGYIFKREVWKSIKRRRVLFENQNYGDYPITQVCAIMARKYKGALIYGDICEIQRRRINFTEEKSRFYEKRKDKRLWFTPEIISKELEIGQEFLKKAGVQESVREKIYMDRYAQYLFFFCVTNYKNVISDPVCTDHYNYYPKRDFFHVFVSSLANGMKLWSRASSFCFIENRRLIPKITKMLWKEYICYFHQISEDKLFGKRKKEGEYRGKDYEIRKRETVLNTYENWVNLLIDKKMISEWLGKNKYSHIAIYGMGRIGKHLLTELNNSDICVDFIIDRKMGKQVQYYENIPCLEGVDDLPRVDIIIVTVSGEAQDIISKLRGKVDTTVKSINDIMFVMD